MNNRIGEWLGPCEVVAFDTEKKLVHVRHASRKDDPPKPFYLAQVKPYYPPEILSHSFLVDLESGITSFQTPKEELVWVKEVIELTDRRALSKQMKQAKLAELRSLFDRVTFKVVLKEDTPANANVLSGRVFLAIKSTLDGQTKFKARYVMGGHKDKVEGNHSTHQ